MHDLPTTLSLVVLTLLALIASVVAIRRLAPATPSGGAALARLQRWLTGICAAGSAAVFIYRWRAVNQEWRPLEAHVDGLLLIAALFALTVLFLQSRSRLPALGAFALPLLTLLLAWAICASAWSFRLFDLDAQGLALLWKALHLGSVYLGTLFCAVAAIAGGMYLYSERRLRNKTPLTPGAGAGATGMGSLEGIETFIVRASALGFALITVGLITGVVIRIAQPAATAPGWWYSAKVILAVLAWAIYALLMNVRHATHFRGARAAWLSMVGLFLLLAVFAVTNALRPHAVPTTRPAGQLVMRAQSRIAPAGCHTLAANSGGWPQGVSSRSLARLASKTRPSRGTLSFDRDEYRAATARFVASEPHPCG